VIIRDEYEIRFAGTEGSLDLGNGSNFRSAVGSVLSTAGPDPS